MTRTVGPPGLRPLPRFTFAGRGCRDSRREPRRLPEALRARPATGATVTAPIAGTSPVGEALAPATERQSVARPSAAPRPDRDDRPPPAPCGTVPAVAASEKGDSAGPLVIERRGDALLIGFNRPEKRNAIDLATTEAVHQVLTDYARERCILVLHSTTPGMFVAGADIGELLKRDADDALTGINVRLFERLEAHRWPTIAVVDGPALGGGCELAMACDLRVASARARFAQPELNLGILAGAGGNWRLPQLVGVAQARRMLYLGETLDADAALAAGLVDAVHEPEAVLDAALDMVATIAGWSWRALELTKLALRLHRPATSTFDMAAQSLLFESDDKRQRMENFLNRRKG